MGKDTGCAEQLEPVIGNDRKRKAGGKAQGKKGSNPQTGNAASEAPPGAERPLRVLSVSLPVPSLSAKSSLQILVRNFYVGNTGNLRNFYVEIAFGYCQLIGILRQIRRTDRVTPLSIGAAHKTGGTRTHFGLVLVCLIDIVNLGVGKQVSDRETRGQYGTSAENRAENGRKQNKG